MRSYNTAPQIWGGSPDCDHTLADTPGLPPMTGGSGTASAKQVTNAGSQFGNAWTEESHTLEIGKARTPALYPRHGPEIANSYAPTLHQMRSATCTRCGAWRGELGSEPLHDCAGWATGAPCGQCFICHLVEVFAAVKRVLRPDGVCLVNLGDSYAAGKTGRDDDGPADLARRAAAYGVGTVKAGAKGANGIPRKPPPGLKAKDLVGIPWRFALAMQAAGWWLRGDYIWCLSGGTRVYARTTKGDMPISVKDLARLRPESVQLWNGERWTQVLGWTETTREEVSIEITLRSGERIGCTPHHEWPTQRGLVRADALHVGDVIQTTRLPEPASPVQPAALDAEDVGWFIGLYLAEGSMSDHGIHIAGHVKETDRYERCQRIAAAYGGTCVWRANGGLSATIHMHGRILRAIITTYLAGANAKEKRLTNAVWQRSDTFLRALLDGYLHGDGHYDALNDRWRLGFTRNYYLEADVRTLCARLGLQLRLKLHQAMMGGRLFPAHRGEIRFTRSMHAAAKPDGEVLAIGKSRGRKFWHIGVADDPHLFALASGVLTANSKPNPMPESVTDRCTRSHEYLFHFSKASTYYWDADAIREAPADTRERITWPERKAAGEPARRGFDVSWAPGGTTSLAPNPAGRNARSVWEIATQPFSGAHFATFPQELVRRAILAGTSERGACAACGAPHRRISERDAQPQAYPDRKYDSTDPHFATKRNMGARYQAQLDEHPKQTIGWTPTCQCATAETRPCVVLDPFAGSSTTLLVARQLGRIGWGAELQPDYVTMSVNRLRQGVLL